MTWVVGVDRVVGVDGVDVVVRVQIGKCRLEEEEITKQNLTSAAGKKYYLRYSHWTRNYGFESHYSCHTNLDLFLVQKLVLHQALKSSVLCNAM